MRKKLALYEKAAREFSQEVARALEHEVDSVVLYGSVARGRAGGESDIDILVISGRKGVEEKVVEIAYQVDYRNNFETLTMPIVLTPEQVERQVSLGSYFINDILTDGVVLHDNGTFRRIREQALGTRLRVS